MFADEFISIPLVEKLFTVDTVGNLGNVGNVGNVRNVGNVGNVGNVDRLVVLFMWVSPTVGPCV